jgi:hypothetical protein
MKKTNLFLTGFLFFLLLSACKNGSIDSKTKTDISYDSISEFNKFKKVVENIDYLLPSPADFLSTISQGDLKYDPKLLNSIEKKENYVKKSDLYLNFGVYITDFSYCALFDRKNDAENYLETIKRISDEVNLSTEIDKELIEKINAQVNTKDSLAKITDEFYFKIVNNLESNKRQDDLAIIITGAYIECLYLSVNNVKEYSDNNLIIQRIAEQKYAFNNMFKNCQKYISSDDLMKSYPYLKQINDAFGQLSKIDEILEVKKDDDNHLLISGGSIIVFTEIEFMSFKDKIIKIRNSITK